MHRGVKSPICPFFKLICPAASAHLCAISRVFENRLFVDIQIREQDWSFLVDTGAQVTTLSETICTSLGLSLTDKHITAEGLGNAGISLSLSAPVDVNLGPKTISWQFWVGKVENILGMDFLRKLNCSLSINADSCVWNIASLKQSDLADHPIWSDDKDDCGLLDMEPVILTGSQPPCTKQYPINKEALQGIVPIIEQLVKRGILVKTQSVSNSPVWPVRKANGTWRLTVDYRVANQHIDKLTPLVADPSTIFDGIPTAHSVFSVVDMANGFWSVPLASQSQPWLAFTVGDEQYQWTRLPQGFHNSPSIYHQALRNHLSQADHILQSSVIVQYVDDVLLSSESEETHDRDVKALLDFLASKGHKASRDKAQLCCTGVQYLGQWVSQGSRGILPARSSAINAMSIPTTVHKLRAFLGLCNYCRLWIDSYAAISQPLYDLLKGNPGQHDPVVHTDDSTSAFVKLKSALVSAPALGLCDPNKPFTVFVHEDCGFMTSCLTQEHGGMQRPVAYHSAKLDAVACGMGPCLRAVQATYLALLSFAPRTLEQIVTVKCPHSVSALLNNGRVLSVTASRWGNWLAVLTAPNVVIQNAPMNNPSSFMMSSLTDAYEEGDDHDCIELSSPHPVFKDIPLDNPDLILFTDGSSTYTNGQRRSGWAVTDSFQTLASGSLPPSYSAQQAELVALTEACKLASGRSTTIYTDSRYAFGVANDFGHLWRNRGFLTAAGTPVKNADLVQNLLEAVKLPTDLAIVKVKAHTGGTSFEAQGNRIADEAAKRASFLPPASIASLTSTECNTNKISSIQKLQSESPSWELWKWLDSGAKVDPEGVWIKGGKIVAPESLLPYLATQIHSLGHIGMEKMVHQFSHSWWNPKFREQARTVVQNCVACNQVNAAPQLRTPANRTVAPPGPFRHLQVDYITLPKCEGKQDVLIVIDKFSRWIEAYPTSKGTATHTAKMLVQDFIPRWGLPEQIESDQGTHFTGQVVQAVCKLLQVNWKLHCPYRPQASGQVERANRVIKERLTKLHNQGVKWTASLPAVLCSIRATSNKTVGLSPYEVVTGRPMLVPGLIDLRKADVHLLSDALLNYCQTLTQAVQAAQNQVSNAWGRPSEGGHTIIPGQWVMVRRHDKQSLEPRWDGPYQVLLITDSAVKCEGKKTWIHVSHCKVVPAPQK
ncbi:hypothetical protein AMEX_G33 [Astyanax mexicanus]|uniref:Gag-Pol polyprotein n=1 Tax=Astyanax mexicanus TaxID=7994 RepID=A0A8T2MBT4_ASTMX|nr:hypothetical protein AMEX_G33 [Astyanax mexicanus]